MNRDRSRDHRAVDEAFAGRLSALAAGLRADGVEPARDLWPDIERALDARAGARGRSGGSVFRRVAPRAWAGAALAASVLLVIGVGVHGLGGVPGPAATAPVSRGAAAPKGTAMGGLGAARQGLQAVDQAFDELQAALRESPDDPELSRLVLLIHHSRGRLLRLQAGSGVREAHGGRS